MPFNLIAVASAMASNLIASDSHGLRHQASPGPAEAEPHSSHLLAFCCDDPVNRRVLTLANDLPPIDAASSTKMCHSCVRCDILQTTCGNTCVNICIRLNLVLSTMFTKIHQASLSPVAFISCRGLGLACASWQQSLSRC